jgi:hypothetical protein
MKRSEYADFRSKAAESPVLSDEGTNLCLPALSLLEYND